jgi:hypothetical protein
VLLGRPPSANLEADFLRAYDIFPALAVSEEWVGRLLRPPLDLEALEIALRRRSPRNPLTQRFQLVSYLAEVRSANLDLYASGPVRPLRGLLVLAAHVPRSLWKALRGRLLLRRADGL